MVSVSQQFVPAWAQLQEISIFSLITGGLRQKQVLTIALFIRPLEMPNPRLLNTSGRGGGSRIGTSCEQTLETGREKPAWIRASMECQHLHTAFSNDSSRPTSVTRYSFCYTSLCYKEGKETRINRVVDVWRCQSLTEEGRCQSLGCPDFGQQGVCSAY